MKFFLLSTFFLGATVGFAQPKLVTQATIVTTTNVIAPEDEDVSQIQPQGGGGGGFNFRNFGDGETKSTTFIKNDLVKTNFKSESFRGTLYRNNTTKTTTTIFEIMGNKQGIVATDDDQVEMRKRMDSTMKARQTAEGGDTTNKPRMRTVDANSNATVTYLDETKKIAGYTCKKALIITDKIIVIDTQVVWYTPEIKFANVPSTGGTSGFGNMGGGTNNFEKVDGFVMMYERKMPRGRVMEVKVTKIDIDKDIAATEFEIPKDVDIKTMKEMQSQGGGMRMMFGGGRQ